MCIMFRKFDKLNNGTINVSDLLNYLSETVNK